MLASAVKTGCAVSSPSARRCAGSVNMSHESAAPRIDFVSELPSELSLKILGTLSDPNDLSACAGVSRVWRVVANDELLWRAHCRRRWKGKFHTPSDALSAEYLAAHEVPRDVADGCMAQWRLTYYFVEKDAARMSITLEELCDFRWTFEFRHIPLMLPMPDFATCSATFYRDFTCTNDVFEDPTHYLPWRFADPDQTTIRVHHYPILTISRSPHNWGWKLKNYFVCFRTAPPAKHARKPRRESDA